jgi:uncharacterized protein with HEPN domain
MPVDDEIRMRHMLDAAKEAVAFARSRTRADLDSDRLLVLGLLKCIEIAGEAAAHVGQQTRARFPQIPWQDIVGMRNRLVHVYFDIDNDQVWSTVVADLPPLIVELEGILDPETGP